MENKEISIGYGSMLKMGNGCDPETFTTIAAVKDIPEALTLMGPSELNEVAAKWIDAPGTFILEVDDPEFGTCRFTIDITAEQRRSIAAQIHAELNGTAAQPVTLTPEQMESMRQQFAAGKTWV